MRLCPIRVLVGLVLCAWLTTEVSAGADVHIVSPRPRATALGPTEIRLEVEHPDEVSIESIEISVDGNPIATLTAPPWSVTWDAGDGARSHSIEARMQLTDGTIRRSVVSTSRLRINATEEVDLVNLYVVVRDDDGDYVKGLEAEDLLVFEDGRPQRIARFTAEPKPLAISFVLDASMTMEGGKLEAARDAALGFLDVLSPRDEAMVVAFNDRARVIQDLTSDVDALERAVRGVEARGGTALYDAVWKAADRLRGRDARRVMILLSDGRDEASNGLEPGSLHTLREALDHALRSEVMVFAIGFGRGLDRQLDFYRRETLASILTRLSESTGGRVMFSKRTGALKRAFEDVADDLRHQYALAYSSDNEEWNGAWREIRLVPKDESLEVVTRSGYYAKSGLSR